MVDVRNNIPVLEDTDIIGHVLMGESGEKYWDIKYYDANYIFPLVESERLGISTIRSLAKDEGYHLKDIVKQVGFFVADSIDGKVFIKHSPRADHELEFYIRTLGEEPHPALMPLRDVIYREVLDEEVQETRKYTVFPFVTVNEEADYSETLEDLISEISISKEDWTERILKIGIQLTSFLAWMHDEHGALHFDIKPRNVIYHYVDNELLIKVIDFEGVRYGTNDPESQRVNVKIDGDDYKLFTPKYSAPELLSPEFRFYGESDVYSAACIIYDLFEGNRKEGNQDNYDEVFEWEDDFEYSLFNAITPAEKNYAKLREYGFLTPRDAMNAEKVPEKLRPVLAKCFELLSCDRYSARGLEVELKRELMRHNN
jgi:serine/threonine protein kinase